MAYLRAGKPLAAAQPSKWEAMIFLTWSSSMNVCIVRRFQAGQTQLFERKLISVCYFLQVWTRSDEAPMNDHHECNYFYEGFHL
jgi:hypothetical protein